MDRRRELKLAYKENPPAKGVYQLRNIINGKIWVASGMNLHGSSNSWALQLKTKTHRVRALQEDWNAYGPEAFVFEILETLKLDEFPKEEWHKAVSAMEDQWLEKLQPYDDRGYNRRKK